MLPDELEKNSVACVGCGACEAICRVHAIKAEPDEDGGLRLRRERCTGCMLCEMVCPQLYARKDNARSPECYAVHTMAQEGRASWEIVLEGLAEHILGQGGAVVGPAFLGDFSGMTYAVAERREELPQLLGIPYVRCRPGDIYQKVQGMLMRGRKVLFLGMPCHVGALRNLLDEEYENLLTVDFLCDGLPLEEVWAKHLLEVAQGRGIQSVEFCHVPWGGEHAAVRIVFDGGTEYLRTAGEDPYLRGIHEHLNTAGGCAVCRSSSPPRQGDFSLGEFRDIGQYASRLRDGGPFFCLSMNNHRARRLFRRLGLRQGLSLRQAVLAGFLAHHDRMQEKKVLHPARLHFRDLCRGGASLRRAVDDALRGKFSAAVVGSWSMPDYGYALSYYALYCALRDLGHTVLMVERRMDILGYALPKAHAFREMPYPSCCVSPVHRDEASQRELNARVEAFVSGSCPVWDPSYLLDFVGDYRKRIAYAGIFSPFYFRGSEERKILGKALKKLDAVSVPEEAEALLLEREFQRSAKEVIDPLFLCRREHLLRLAEKSMVPVQGKYLFSYFRFPGTDGVGIDRVAEKLRCNFVALLNMDEGMLQQMEFQREAWACRCDADARAEDWLKCLMGSSFVITDSYHAVCLALREKKPFIYIQGSPAIVRSAQQRQEQKRTLSLLDSLGLGSRAENTVHDVLMNGTYLEKMDGREAQARLWQRKRESLAWLRKALK